MKDLVFRGQNDQVITTSLLVAETFEKEHRNVLKSIRKLMSATNVAVAQMFDETTYVNEQGKEQPMFFMNRDGFTLLAMGFSGEKALKFKVDYINAFNKMEAELKSQQAKQLSAAESLLQSVQLLVAHERQLAILEHNQKNMQGAISSLYDKVYGMQFQTNMIEQKLNNEIDRYTIIGYCSAHNIQMTLTEASVIGGMCSRMCKKRNIPLEPIADRRFGKVNTYPSELIAEAIKNRQAKQN